MAGDKDVNLQIGADGSQANAEFEKVADSAMSSAQRIQSAFREAGYNMANAMTQSMDKINSEFNKVINVAKHFQGAMVAVGVALAGGKAFKDIIDQTVNLTKESTALSKALGITVTEASVLKVALGGVFVSSDTLLAANSKLTRSLKDNEKAFTDLGVKTRDSNGDFRNSLDIMLDVNKRLLSFKEGVDRNIEGQKIYGKTWAEVSGVLKLTTEKMEEARTKAAALSLVVGQENVEATVRYRAAMNDVDNVFTAIKKSIGDALIPVLTQLANWFADVGPTAVTIIKGAIGGLTAVLWGLKFYGEMVWNSLAFEIEVVTIKILQLADTASKALRLDFSGARAAWENGSEMIEEVAKKRLKNVADAAEETRDKLWNLFAQPTATVSKGGGETSDGGKEKKAKQTTRFDEWHSQLEKMKDDEQAFFKDYLKDEIAFWQSKLDTVKLNSREERQIRHELYTLHKQDAQQQLQSEIADLKSQSEAAQAGGVERIRIAGEIAARIGEKYGQESKEYKNAVADMQKVAHEHQQQMLRLDEMRIERQKEHEINELDMRRETLRAKRELGEITEAKELQGLRDLEEQKYQIEYKAQLDHAALLDNDVIAQQQAYDKLEKMAEKHAADMQKINSDIAIKQKAEWDKLLQPVQSAFDTTVKGIIQGTTTLQKGIVNIFRSIAIEFANMGVKMVTQWIANEARKTLATEAGTTARAAAEAQGSSLGLVTQASSAIKAIGNYAVEVFAAVYKALAGIPFIGPEIAPASAAMAMGTVAGMAVSIQSASGGFDIPAGVNPLTQLHKREMVLPEKYADTIRNLADSGSGGGATVNYHDYSGRLTKQDIERNAATIVRVLKGQHRNFAY